MDFDSLQVTGPRGMMAVSRGGWIACPVCRQNQRLLRITPATRARALPVYCRKCKSEILITVERRREP